jgi:hypothetical protein
MPSNKHFDTGKYSSFDYCHICSGDLIEKNEMRETCSTYGSVERYMQSFGGERDNLEDTGVGVKIILRWILRKWNVWAWTELICLKIETGGGHL